MATVLLVGGSQPELAADVQEGGWPQPTHHTSLGFPMGMDPISTATSSTPRFPQIWFLPDESHPNRMDGEQKLESSGTVWRN